MITYDGAATHMCIIQIASSSGTFLSRKRLNTAMLLESADLGLGDYNVRNEGKTLKVIYKSLSKQSLNVWENV